MIHIRLAAETDLGVLETLYSDFYAFHAGLQPDYYLVARESGQYPKSVIDGVSGDILFALAGDIAVGFLHIEEDKTPPYASVAPHRFAQVVDVYLQPDWRNKGIGAALLEYAKAWAKERGLEYLELFVLEENAPGRRFYEREGFVAASRTLRCRL
jgi:GNAT superfamily N-acetyltransferase